MDAGNRDIDQFGDPPPSVTDRGLRPHGGIAGADDDLFGLEACGHVLVPFPVSWRRLGYCSSSYVLDPVDK
jgi:hypothetical protein